MSNSSSEVVAVRLPTEIVQTIRSTAQLHGITQSRVIRTILESRFASEPIEELPDTDPVEPEPEPIKVVEEGVFW